MRILETRSLLWPDEAACETFARELARCPGLMEASIELHGALGAGKTSLVRHLLRALGVSGRIKSPSYAVLESYSIERGEVSHFDFYRFADPREWEDAGFRDIFSAPGLKLSEWPEKAAGVLPLADLQIWLSVQADDSRAVRLVAGTERGQLLLQGLEGQE
ncbi:tRNA (adenosine(37)-N6)-threonylcarbamoyltransferase complex ATPase subunit type 1 TsaE [Roseateles violae]|uniref:tRNA threonylcarbamoyladenosine biosynthesis protein TsaE n=1 Tax=Roseateles violae TaxID=3058042 RepID=A0ABT8DRF7_9BURK|nr:tRNA (adenosine(37)-N6)-threonylcarbamoyltransferase complex ATPase subunit type 1 TsaE [Pelomonas sp. PFR6]MDN3920616.1 tRNA (adenosine(37)-N6)-threonylcarbamoyltransferase complex ATPase subunit type 1 TsaE [Pelomonas sp. PFR6]